MEKRKCKYCGAEFKPNSGSHIKCLQCQLIGKKVYLLLKNKPQHIEI